MTDLSEEDSDGVDVILDHSKIPQLAPVKINQPGKQQKPQACAIVDPRTCKEKPWRNPNANIADYFNYGFNEETFIDYVENGRHPTRRRIQDNVVVLVKGSLQ